MEGGICWTIALEPNCHAEDSIADFHVLDIASDFSDLASDVRSQNAWVADPGKEAVAW